MEVSNILSLIAGLGFFLYGMKIMGDGLEKTAGDRMSSIIDSVTGNLFKGVLVGTAVTAIIQSSSATTVMVVGFINAGIMTLKQSIGVILGANIGTCITAVLVSLESIDVSKVVLLNLIKPSNIAPIAVAAGVVMLMFIKKKKYNSIGEILAGFGILFIGMDMMSGSMEDLQNMSIFTSFMQTLKNPILGVLFGTIFTMIIQSSSASIGMLQAATISGVIPFPAAVTIVLGCNIGTCITAVISSIGTKKDARRAAAMNVIIKAFGAMVFVIVLYALGVGKLLPAWNGMADYGNIAVFHITFNCINVLLMLPFTNLLVKAVTTLIPDDNGKESDNPLDERLLATPSLALAQALKELSRMMTLAGETVRYGYDIFTGELDISNEKLEEVEESIDIDESRITQYLVKIGDEKVSEEENAVISSTFHVLTDVERIGDHAFNISVAMNEMKDNNIKFSAAAQKELTNMYKAVNKLVGMTIQAYETTDVHLATAVQPLEDVIDYLQEDLKRLHLERLAKHECTFNAGVIFLDIVNNLERIADHCSNIGLAVEQVKSDNNLEFDPHAYLKYTHDNKSDEYRAVYDKYIRRYTGE